MRRGTVLAAVLAGMILGAASLAAQGALQWHGYVQLRYARSDPSTGFTVRRAKLWMNGPVPRIDHLAFKIQGIFRNGSSGAFMLQDVFALYQRSAVSVRLGQFVPDFSLERSQPDYRVPLVERAAAVEAMIPGSRTLGRETGAELSLVPASAWLRLSAGIFDGSGANHAPGTAGDYLATGRLVLKRRLENALHGSVGASFALRETHGADVGLLSSASDPFVGRDERWGAEGRLRADAWSIQAEYLHADLAGEISDGFYVLGTIAVGSHDQVAVSEESLHTPGPASIGPWFVVGYTRYLPPAPGATDAPAPQDTTYPTKVVTDFRVTSDDGRIKVVAAVQVQMFLR
jgi:hypothetical protein